jgi:WhiB family redox-sensing transcriptional regulator
MDTEFLLHPETDVSWTEQAICKGLTHVFFGPPAERPERRVEREAIAASYCLACPVMATCRQTARLNREHGFWGCENDEQRAAAGYAPRSPSRRAVIEARDSARQHHDRFAVSAGN